MVVLDRSGTGVQIVVKSLLLFSSLFSLIKEKGPSAVVGNKHVKNAVGAQSGEDSLRASHLKGGACPPLTIKKERFRGKERDFTTNLVLSFFMFKVRHSHKAVFRPPYSVCLCTLSRAAGLK